MAGLGPAGCAPICCRRAQSVPGMGQGASRLPRASLSRAAKPVAGEDRGRPCWLRKGIGYRPLVHARSAGGQPSQETVSESAGRAT